MKNCAGPGVLPLLRYPLYLIERDRVASAIVELRRAGAFMCRHGLGVFQRTTSFKISSDAGCTKRMTTDSDLHAKPLCPALDHAPGIDPVHRLVGQRAGATASRAEEGGLGRVANASPLYMACAAERNRKAS